RQVVTNGSCKTYSVDGLEVCRPSARPRSASRMPQTNSRSKGRLPDGPETATLDRSEVEPVPPDRPDLECALSGPFMHAGLCDRRPPHAHLLRRRGSAPAK